MAEEISCRIVKVATIYPAAILVELKSRHDVDGKIRNEQGILEVNCGFLLPLICIGNFDCSSTRWEGFPTASEEGGSRCRP